MDCGIAKEEAMHRSIVEEEAMYCVIASLVMYRGIVSLAMYCGIASSGMYPGILGLIVRPIWPHCQAQLLGPERQAWAARI